MPLVDIQLIQGVFDKAQKQASGEWGIGGKGMTVADVKALQEQGT